MKAQFKKYPPELCEIVMMDVDEPVTIGKAFKGNRHRFSLLYSELILLFR